MSDYQWSLVRSVLLGSALPFSIFSSSLASAQSYTCVATNDYTKSDSFKDIRLNLSGKTSSSKDGVSVGSVNFYRLSTGDYQYGHIARFESGATQDEFSYSDGRYVVDRESFTWKRVSRGDKQGEVEASGRCEPGAKDDDLAAANKAAAEAKKEVEEIEKRRLLQSAQIAEAEWKKCVVAATSPYQAPATNLVDRALQACEGEWSRVVQPMRLYLPKYLSKTPAQADEMLNNLKNANRDGLVESVRKQNSE